MWLPVKDARSVEFGDTDGRKSQISFEYRSVVLIKHRCITFYAIGESRKLLLLLAPWVFLITRRPMPIRSIGSE
jgi:hypothetical protein